MDCTQTRDYLHGYLDGELDAVTAAALEAHLQSCAGCKQAYETQLALRSAIRQHADYHTARDELRARVRAGIGAAAGHTTAQARGPRWHWLQLGAAVAVTAVVSWIAALQFGQPSPDELIAEQLIAGHARAALTDHLVDVASADQHTVKPWLSSRLSFSPPVSDLAAAGFPLAGGRLEYFDHRPVAALVYRHRQHVIDLYIWADAKAGRATAQRTVSKQGYNVLHWTDAGMAFWAVSDLNPDELEAFTRAYSQQAAR